MTVNSTNMEKNPKLLMFKSRHDIILKKSKIKNYPQIFLNRPGTPSTQEAEAGIFVRPRPIAVYIENLDSKTKQTNTQNVARPHGTNLQFQLLGKLWQEAHKFKACLGYQTSSRPKALSTY